MKKEKQLRKSFVAQALKRDKNACVICHEASDEVHHITDRHEMPNGGYALENGITLCSSHHFMAEMFHISKQRWWCVGFHPNDLYDKIDASFIEALNASREL